MGDLRAGAAVVDISPGVNLAMGGYGARKGTSLGTHDALNVRTLVLSDGTAEVVLAICDLVGVSPALVEQARGLIESELGIPPANVCVAATHTHSGPLASAETMADYLSVTARKIAGSAQIARRGMRAVTLKLATADVSTISQNRRHPEGPKETVARVLLAAPAGGGEPVATLVNYACHATVLDHENLHYSADFPGAAMRSVEREVGGVGLYMQGAAGDINPVWMRHDFIEVDRVGGILGAAAARAVHELRPLGEGQSVANLSWGERLHVEPAPGTVLGDPSLAGARTFLDLPRRALPPPEEIERELTALRTKIEALPPEAIDERRALYPKLARLRMDSARAAQSPPAPGETQRIELQAFRISGQCAILALPGEFFVEIGRELQRRSGVEHLLLCGYANDFISYIPAASDFQHDGYEVGRGLFAPGAADAIIEAAASLVASLYARSAP